MRTEDTTLDDLTNPGPAKDFFKRREMKPFEVNATGFSVPNAVWLMELSRLVYRHEAPEANPVSPARSSLLQDVGFRQVKFFESKKTNTQAFLVRRDDFAVLAFRGTERNLEDVITDVLIQSKKVSGDEVHSGFADAFASVWPEIELELEKLDCPVFYTGHSLGGALATLAAFTRPPKCTYTFGSPRVGKKKFVDSMKNADMFRVVDDLDEVTVVPPMAFGYVHVGNEHKLHETPEPAPILKHTWKHLADHAPVNYVDRL